MIDDTTLCFPNNICDLITTRAATYIDSEVYTQLFPIDDMSADQTLAVIPVSWSPVEPPEMVGQGSGENAIQSYTVMIQALVNDADEVRAIRRHSVFSTLVRRMLYRDPILRGGLNSLTVTVAGVTEQTTQFGVRQQQFLTQRSEASFQYLSAIEFWLHTQIRTA